MRVRMTRRPFSIWIGNKDRSQSLDRNPEWPGVETGHCIRFKLAGHAVGKLHPAHGRQSPALRRRLGRAHFILHVSEGRDSLHHLDVWHAFCQAVDPNLIVAIRNRHLFERIATERPEVTAVYVKAAREAEWLVSSVPALKAVLYVSTTGNGVHFVRHNGLKHIFIGHGDSEKVASSGKQFRLYDEIWTAGRAHIDRFNKAGFDFSSVRFRVVGRPLARPLIDAPEAGQPDHFLYLPTWEGFQNEQNYTSARLVESTLADIAAATSLGGRVKFHPYTGNQDPRMAAVESRLRGDEIETGRGASHQATHAGIRVIDRDQPATRSMAGAAFLIADISSVVSDFLVTGRPIFLYMPQGTGIGMSASTVPMDQYCYTFSEPEELRRLVRRVIVEGEDYLRESRLAARMYFVDIERTRNHQFERELRRMMDEAPDWQGKDRSAAPRRHPLIVAHRGVTHRAPENSLTAFRDAVNLEGLDGVEFDVHLSADGAMPIMHDPELNRTSNGKGAIGDANLAYLQQLRLKAAADRNWIIKDESVPTLEQVLAILAPSDLELHIEIKNDALGAPYPGLPAKVLALIHELGIAERCILTSFTPSVLEGIRHLDAEVRLLASVNRRLVETLGGIEPTLRRFQAIDGCLIALEDRVLAAMHRYGWKKDDLGRYGIWVVNDDHSLRSAFKQGYRQITTDRAQAAIQIRDGATVYDAIAATS